MSNLPDDQILKPTKTLKLEDGLTLYTFYLECLAHGSYMVCHEGNCFIVDPRRDIGIYSKYLQDHNLKLKGVLESHLHADFVSGHMELHKRYGATIFIGEDAGAQFPHYPCGDGEMLLLSSKYAIRAMPTPGHTPGCVTWVVVERATDKAVMAFTGDTLFVGGCGRPDLVGALNPDLTPEVLSKMMFKSLREKILSLPDECLVFPAHGPGSPCGKGISADLSSTIGKEKETNPALQIDDEQKFIEFNTAGLDTAPQYFPSAVMANLKGADDLDREVENVTSLSISEFKAAMGDDVVILDTRNAGPFAAGHIKGALNIPLGLGGGVHLEYEDGNFAIWVGTLIAPKAKVLIIAEEGKGKEAIERLGRIGYAQQIIGNLKSGMETWIEAGEPVDKFDKITVESADTIRQLQAKGYVIVDTRTSGEYSCVVRGHVKGSINLPLAELPQSCSALDRDKKYVVYCLGGFRSAIAVSLLRQKGFDAVDFVGGYDRGILAKGCEMTTAQPDVCDKAKAAAEEASKPTTVSI
ncbi:beta-lactamase domain-containing protein [Salpingoeca rosetta]|uniref:Beta-lactamase domain-containing protein n=1 Tax=Salpingoeca rosetta (strain ATCC 50818 / BSB-021) TaxID=946362 RepID=F2UGF3_SALR5|nr:beta-lactamase domain-containing protein [Salpingoeca rosetta]EGD75703.1 beta-lactamase domain-containing protein [Salpingoeca rosetta]|eukprot:XP_004991624.1 beta-lactamase domain-containing protein [Salpingoeca rosetta]